MTKLEKIVEDVYPNFEGMDDIFKAHSEGQFQSYCHSMLSGGISIHIRNHYNLWDEESENHRYFKSIGIEHPDEMSAMIVGEVYKKYFKK